MRLGLRRAVAGALIAVGTVSACTAPSASAVAEAERKEARSISSKDSAVPGEWIVTIQPGVSRDLLLRRYAVLGILDARRIMEHRYHLRFPADAALTERALLDAGRGDVLAVQPNYRYRLNAVP